MNEDMKTYSYNEVDSFIWDLKNAVQTMREENERLVARNSEEKMNDVMDFMRINETSIDAQVTLLTDLSNEIHELLRSNDDSQKKEDAYQSVLESDDYQSIVAKVNKIKELQDSLKHFLGKRGISSPP